MVKVGRTPDQLAAVIGHEIGRDPVARAGFDPRASVTLWLSMAAAEGAQPLVFLQSWHPAETGGPLTSTFYPCAVTPKPNTSRPAPQHKVYPYLQRGLEITRPNQVWCADVTYIRLAKGFVYFDFYNHERPHQTHGGLTPALVYNGAAPLTLVA